jgi:hypothetical protein
MIHLMIGMKSHIAQSTNNATLFTPPKKSLERKGKAPSERSTNAALGSGQMTASSAFV